MPEIHKMLALTTAHVSQKTAEFLDQCAAGDRFWDWGRIEGDSIYGPITYDKSIGNDAESSYGWFIPLDPNNWWHPDLPAELHAIRAKAEELGCTWIMFDRDAETVDGLEEFDW